MVTNVISNANHVVCDNKKGHGNAIDTAMSLKSINFNTPSVINFLEKKTAALIDLFKTAGFNLQSYSC